jgi:hypothetical protein
MCVRVHLRLSILPPVHLPGGAHDATMWGRHGATNNMKKFIIVYDRVSSGHLSIGM